MTARFLILFISLVVGVEARAESLSQPPNVLFLAVDDMNDWTSTLGGYAGKVHTPNLERLATLGCTFDNAHTASPVCCPSRTAILLGLRPSTTGIYNNGQWWRPHLPNARSLPMVFREQGYTVLGAGKIFHHTAGFNPPDQWHDFQRLVFRDDPWFRGHKTNYPWSKPTSQPEGYPFSGLRGTPHEGDWGVIPNRKEAQYDDAQTVNYAVRALEQETGKPLFLACGIFRPHLPWYAPQRYFDLYPLEEIELPAPQKDDLDDVPKEGRALAAARRKEFDNIKQHGKWREAVQAYLASISFADAQLGRVLDALAKRSDAENTIVVLWSDHGWHLGEKNHWHKSTLWEEATRIPLHIVAPGVTTPDSRCAIPVDTLAIFPTLLDLCGLDAQPDLDGVSIVPLLRDPERAWSRPAITEFKRGQCAVRSERFRYIRYGDGSEELYDHDLDPNEWINLADKPEHQALIKQLAQWIPSSFAKSAPSKRAYRFDPDTYKWTRKTK